MVTEKEKKTAEEKVFRELCDYVKKEITTRYLGMGVSFRYA